MNTLLPIAHLITNNDLEQIVVYSKSSPQYRQHSGQHSFLARYSSKSNQFWRAFGIKPEVDVKDSTAASPNMSAVYDEHRSPWLKYATSPVPAQVKAETGFSADTLEFIWDKYEHVLPQRERDQEARRRYFYFVWRYIHMYPTWEQSPVVLWTPELIKQKGKGISRTSLWRNVLLYLARLALAIDEVHWSERLNEYNHVPEFATHFTTMVDTMPVFVAESLDKSSSSKTFQPKYGDNVFKLQVRVYCSDDADSDLGLQIVITLTGHIVGYTGLHWGVTPDNLIWRWTRDELPLEPWELTLGDGIYLSAHAASCHCTDPVLHR